MSDLLELLDRAHLTALASLNVSERATLYSAAADEIRRLTEQVDASAEITPAGVTAGGPLVEGVRALAEGLRERSRAALRAADDAADRGSVRLQARESATVDVLDDVVTQIGTLLGTASAVVATPKVDRDVLVRRVAAWLYGQDERAHQPRAGESYANVAERVAGALVDDALLDVLAVRPAPSGDAEPEATTVTPTEARHLRLHADCDTCLDEGVTLTMIPGFTGEPVEGMVPCPDCVARRPRNVGAGALADVTTPEVDRDALADPAALLDEAALGVEGIPDVPRAEMRAEGGAKCNTCRLNTAWVNGACINPRCETNWIAVPRDLAAALAARPVPSGGVDRQQVDEGVRALARHLVEAPAETWGVALPHVPEGEEDAFMVGADAALRFAERALVEFADRLAAGTAGATRRAVVCDNCDPDGSDPAGWVCAGCGSHVDAPTVVARPSQADEQVAEQEVGDGGVIVPTAEQVRAVEALTSPAPAPDLCAALVSRLAFLREHAETTPEAGGPR